MPTALRPILAVLALSVVVGAMSAFVRTAPPSRVVPADRPPSAGKARLIVIPADRATTTTIVLTGTGTLGSFRFTAALIKATPKT